MVVVTIYFNNESQSNIIGQVMHLFHCRTHMLLRKLGLYPGQPRILFILWKEDGRSQRELVGKLNVAPATVTVMLNRMEKAGFVERRSDPKDLRVSRVFLTAKGRNVRFQVEEIFKKVEQECFNGLSVEDMVMLKGLLIKIRDNFEKSCKDKQE